MTALGRCQRPRPCWSSSACSLYSGQPDACPAIAWTLERDAPYVPPPLLYDDVLHFPKTNTLRLAGLTAMDSGGGLVLDPEFTSASGTQYTVNGVVSAVAEPASFVLLGSGLALGARLRRPRSRT